MSLKRMIHLHFLMLMSRPSGPQASRATISMTPVDARPLVEQDYRGLHSYTVLCPRDSAPRHGEPFAASQRQSIGNRQCQGV